MKKWIIIEICVLALLIISACAVCIGLAQSDPQPQTQPSTQATTQATEATEPTETTAPLVPTWMVLPDDYVLTCQQYFVYDVDADRFTMISGSPEEKVYPASITKLFTAHVAMQYLTPETEVTVGEERNMIDWDSTVAQLQVGDTLPAGRLVEGMLLPSGNDAAHVLAAAAGRVIAKQPELSPSAAVAAFVQEMNRQAQALGMTGSRFANPDGIHHDAHYLTLQDMALLGKLSLNDPLITGYTMLETDEMELSSGPVTWENTNALVWKESQYYCEYAVGLKTGRTTEAGNCLLSAFQVRDRKLIIGVFGCPEVEYRFSDTLFLLNTELGLQ